MAVLTSTVLAGLQNTWSHGTAGQDRIRAIAAKALAAEGGAVPQAGDGLKATSMPEPPLPVSIGEANTSSSPDLQTNQIFPGICAKLSNIFIICI